MYCAECQFCGWSANGRNASPATRSAARRAVIKRSPRRGHTHAGQSAGSQRDICPFPRLIRAWACPGDLAPGRPARRSARRSGWPPVAAALPRPPGLATPAQPRRCASTHMCCASTPSAGDVFAQAVKASVSKLLANRASRAEALSVCAGESGQGRGRTADLPLFRRIRRVATCGCMWLDGRSSWETIARCRLMSPDVGRRWLPVWLPNLVSAANVR